MQNIHIITPRTKIEIKRYYQIRFEELRKPWGQPIGSEKDSMENKCIHRMIKAKNRFAGVARMQYNNKSEAQIRYMAIMKRYQRQGLGKILILDLEEIAKNNGISEIMLQSRASAIEFYKSLDYNIEKKTHLLFGEIQHFLMRKFI